MSVIAFASLRVTPSTNVARARWRMHRQCRRDADRRNAVGRVHAQVRLEARPR